LRVLIAGVDGYLGWPLALHLAELGHAVGGIDCHLRRKLVSEVGSHSATPIQEMGERLTQFRKRFGMELSFVADDLRDYSPIQQLIRSFQPDAIVHLAEIPSAPYSMMDVHRCVFTQMNNITGTLHLIHAMRDECPNSHLVKLGTMGEYGTPNVDIPEGFFEIEYRGRKDRLPFPRQAGSWYHQSKVHDSNNIMMACKLWKLRATDVMQGVVYGTRIEAMGSNETFLTRFDFDQCFGTAINRFCSQAVIGQPLTPFGAGGQKRGFLPLKDSIQCLTLAIEHPPKAGEYRVFNQFEEVYTLSELAGNVKRAAEAMGLAVEIRNIENPRVEAEEHYYKPDRRHLLDLGYRPSRDMASELKIILNDLVRYKMRILERADVLLPDIRWDGTRRPCAYKT